MQPSKWGKAIDEEVKYKGSLKSFLQEWVLVLTYVHSANTTKGSPFDENGVMSLF